MSAETLIRDPDTLLSEWQALTERHHHLHQPQAAALLGLPEASLVAALSGQSATRLEGDPAEILERVAAMGKLIMAVSHHAGVLIGIAKPVRFQRAGQRLILADDHNRLEVDADAVAHLYVLINEKGMHGRERHLQAFDQDGRALFKLLVLYKRHAAELAALAEHYRSPDQRRSLTLPLPAAVRPPETNLEPGPLCDDLLQWSKTETPILATVECPNVSLSCQTRQPKVYGMEDGFLHFSHATMKLHGRLGLLGQIDRSDSSWHCRRQDSRLTFQRMAEAA